MFKSCKLAVRIKTRTKKAVCVVSRDYGAGNSGTFRQEQCVDGVSIYTNGQQIRGDHTTSCSDGANGNGITDRVARHSSCGGGHRDSQWKVRMPSPKMLVRSWHTAK